MKSRRIPSRTPLFFPIPAIGALALACFVTLGCGEKGASTTETSSVQAPDADSAARDLAISAVDIMNLETLGLSTDPSAAISNFNQAYSQSVTATEKRNQSIERAKETWSRLLTAEERESAAGDLYTVRDGKHIWDALMCKALSYPALGAAETDLERVENAFSFVVRNLPLIDRYPNDLPLTLQEVWTMGRATTEGRAWAFASILRQLRIDSVLLLSPETSEDDNGTFVIAVLLGDGAYLFEPRLGLAVPGPDAKKTATLAEVVATPEFLARLAVDQQHPYPLTADALSHPRVELIGDSDYWAPRMRILEDAFLGDHSVLLYDGLQEENDQSGYFGRVAAAGGERWTSESIAIWDYPERQLTGSEHLSVSQKESLRGLKDSWRASWDGTPSGPSQSSGFSASKRSQFVARTKQLIGDYSQAIKLYVKIGSTNRAFGRLQQGEFVSTLFPEKTGMQEFDDSYNAAEKKKIREMAQFQSIDQANAAQKQQLLKGLLEFHRNNIRQHRIAARDGAYWVGGCHFESGKIPASRETFQRYLNNDPSGTWATGARYYIAVGQAIEGDYAAAAATLAGTPPGDPSYDGHQVQIRIWKQFSQDDKK